MLYFGLVSRTPLSSYYLYDEGKCFLTLKLSQCLLGTWLSLLEQFKSKLKIKNISICEFEREFIIQFLGNIWISEHLSIVWKVELENII